MVIILNGILIIDKPKGITSRDVVNKIGKILCTNKVGHTGTLDPLATGVLVLCIGRATKLVELLTSTEKEYIARVKLGILTDTLDTDGNIIKKEKCTIKKGELINVFNSFLGEYDQEVPLYSAVKINGKKLYEYARKNIEVKLPKRKVNIKSIELLQFNGDSYEFKTVVSKGTYIRSLIRDINNKLNIIGSMSELRRIRQGSFDIKNAYTIEQIEQGKYNMLSITDVLKSKRCIEMDNFMYKKVINGQLLDNIYNEDEIVFTYNNRAVAIYTVYEKDKNKIKPYKMLL